MLKHVKKRGQFLLKELSLVRTRFTKLNGFGHWSPYKKKTNVQFALMPIKRTVLYSLKVKSCLAQEKTWPKKQLGSLTPPPKKKKLGSLVLFDPRSSFIKLQRFLNLRHWSMSVET